MSTSTSLGPEPSDSSQNPNVLPIPYDDLDPIELRGEIYFWDTSLPWDNDVVCRTGLANTWLRPTRICCAPLIGTKGSQACRMHNTTENMRYFENCTMQYALEERPDATPQLLNLTCVSFQTFADITRQQKLNKIAYADRPSKDANTSAKFALCSTVGDPDRFNYTSDCCKQLEGETVGAIQGGYNAPMYCQSPKADEDNAFRDGFLTCLRDKDTIGVCGAVTKSSARGRERSAAVAPTAPRLGACLLLAGAGLALLA